MVPGDGVEGKCSPRHEQAEGEAHTVGIILFCEISASEPMAKLKLSEQNYLLVPRLRPLGPFLGPFPGPFLRVGGKKEKIRVK